MRTFSIQTLGCKVNQYESEQMASLLRSRGWVETEAQDAELRIVNTCSVTMEAASKSRQMVRRAVRGSSGGAGHQVVVAGCWATSDKEAAKGIAGVTGVITHQDDVADRLEELTGGGESNRRSDENGDAASSKLAASPFSPGRLSLPLLNHRQPQQRAFLKIQDGCDAHCTYCIIPKLRPLLWSKPVEDLVTEARQLVDAGHVEIVLTGIFLGAYGQKTALRRRQGSSERGESRTDSLGAPLAEAIEALCTKVPGLRRVRLSSLEPGDMNDRLLGVLRSHKQVVPHFHLPLQSGSDELLRRMNRQYSRDDFLRLVNRIGEAFDRPALTTDIIVAFPGETEAAFEQTLEVVDRARFIHIHAFPYSPRPGTAAARWKKQFVPPKVADGRIDELGRRANRFSLEFRSTFVGQTVQLLVERGRDNAENPLRHGRCERYFDVHFEGESVAAGDFVEVRIERVTPTRTFGVLTSIISSGPEREPR